MRYFAVQVGALHRDRCVHIVILSAGIRCDPQAGHLQAISSKSVALRRELGRAIEFLPPLHPSGRQLGAKE